MDTPAFVDPRDNPRRERPLPQRLSDSVDEIRELVDLCKAGRLYDVEQWIRDGRPLQLDPAAIPKGYTGKSPLQIGIRWDNQALVLLLLCNGYRPNLDRHCRLSTALGCRRFDLVELLLGWGADPHRVDLYDLFETYSTPMYERFLGLGVDLGAGRDLADMLSDHASAKPLFGFVKRHRETTRGLQEHVNAALAFHVRNDNEKGVALCLWAGANPHEKAAYLPTESPTSPEVFEYGTTPIETACFQGNVAFLEKLGADPRLDDWDELYLTARTGEVVDWLFRRRRPRAVSKIITRMLGSVRYSGYGRGWALVRLFELGVRWLDADPEEVDQVRRDLLSANDDTFNDVVQLLSRNDYVADGLLRELGRTATFRKRLQAAKGEPRYPKLSTGHEPYSHAGRARERFGAAPRVRPSVPGALAIGSRRDGTNEVELTREQFHERVWSMPVSKLGPRWGVSGTALKKACAKLKVPCPPRGYWAQLAAGGRPRREPLPNLDDDVHPVVFVYELTEPHSNHTS